MAENQLEITQNGQFKNINIRNLENGDSIVVTKKFADVRRTEKPGKFKPEDTWVSVQAIVEYNGQDVGFFINGYYGLEKDGEVNKYVDSQVVADAFDACGGVGEKVKISVKAELGKKFNKKTNANETIPVYDITFSKVE